MSPPPPFLPNNPLHDPGSLCNGTFRPPLRKQCPCPSNVWWCFRNVWNHPISRFHFLVLGDGLGVFRDYGAVYGCLFRRCCLLCCVSSELASSELHWTPISCACTMMPPFLSHCLCLLRARVDNAFVQTTPLSKQRLCPNNARCCLSNFLELYCCLRSGAGGVKRCP